MDDGCRYLWVQPKSGVSIENKCVIGYKGSDQWEEGHMAKHS